MNKKMKNFVGKGSEKKKKGRRIRMSRMERVVGITKEKKDGV